MSAVHSLILAVIWLFCLVSSGVVRAEQIHIQFGEDRGAGTVISHNGACVVLSVLHVLNPEKRGFRAYAVGQKAPESPNLEVLELPFGAQNHKYARLGQLTGWTDQSCPMSLTWVRDDAWTTILGGLARDTGFSGDLFLRVIDEPGFVDVPVRLQRSPMPDTFDFFIDPGTADTIPDGAGISGSGIYYAGAISARQGRLVGIVNGASTTSNAYTAIRIEPIVRALGLAVYDDGPDDSVAGQGNAPGVTADTVAASVPKSETECDRSAANPADPGRHPRSQGIVRDAIDIAKALRDCQIAYANHPASSRLAYQLGRVRAFDYLAAPEPTKFVAAVDTLNEALAAGHGHAIINLGDLLLRDLPECGGIDKCLASYMGSLDVLAEIDPTRAAIERGRMRVYGDHADRLCPDQAVCVAELAATYGAVPPGPGYSEAQAQIAFLVLHRGFQRDCPDDAGCRGFLRQALATRADEQIGWAARVLGDLYAANEAIPGGCDTRAECRTQAIAAWQQAGQLGDARAFKNLGDRAFGSDWLAAFACADQAACRKESYAYYVKAATQGVTEANRAVAWSLLYDPDATGCGDSIDCLRLARGFLLEEKFAETASGKSLLADAIRKYPNDMADLCGAEGCPKRMFDLYRRSSELGSGYGKFRIGETYEVDAELLADNPEAVTISGCATSVACLDNAIVWYQQSASSGRTSDLGNWLRALVTRAYNSDGDEAVIELNRDLAVWLDQVETLSGARVSDVDEEFLRLMSISRDADPPICDGFAARCEALRAAILSYASATDDADYVRDLDNALYCYDECDAGEIALMGRVAAAGSTFVLSDYDFLSHLNTRVCPFAQPVCPFADTNSFADNIRTADLSDLRDLEFKLDEGFVPPLATEQITAILAEKGSSVVQTMREVDRLVAIYQGDGGVADVPEDRARAAVDAFVARLQQGGRGDTLDSAALHLMFLDNHPVFQTLPAEVRVDLAMFFLMVVGRSDETNWNTWIDNRPTEITEEIQRRLGVTPDGNFGPASWAAAEQLAADYQRFNRKPQIDQTLADLGDEASEDYRQAHVRLSRFAPEQMLERIIKAMSL
ncbi:MAG: hypothetical protein INF93_07525 [Rhodobacter sp.]|nr:hypothetical protein [Rhodobacter sp.]